MDVTTLLTVETAGGSWFRFVVTGNHVGGELKSTPDSESLQASWIPYDKLEELPLRSHDVISIITNYVKEFKDNTSSTMWPRDILPVTKSHAKNYVRLICTIKSRTRNGFQLLHSERDETHFPLFEIHPERNLYSTLIKFLKEIFGSDLPQHRPQGILSVEHQPEGKNSVNSPTDGICLNLLVLFRPPVEEVSMIGKYEWKELDEDASRDMAKLIAAKSNLVALNVLR